MSRTADDAWPTNTGQEQGFTLGRILGRLGNALTLRNSSQCRAYARGVSQWLAGLQLQAAGDMGSGEDRISACPRFDESTDRRHGHRLRLLEMLEPISGRSCPALAQP